MRLDPEHARLYPRARVRLADVIGQWIGRVELVVIGADGDFREGQDALAAGDAIGARAAAHRVLARVPASPLGLALLADACDAAHLDAELALTLEELARRAPSRAEVWVRLGHARSATLVSPAQVRDAFARALAVAESGSDARRDALLSLADLDLAEGHSARAELWLERMPNDLAPEVVVRRAEARLSGGDASGALALVDSVSPAPTDGRAALVRGRALASLGDGAAFASLVRAMVLDAPGASEALSEALAHLPSDPQILGRVEAVLEAKGEASLERWQAALARARGDRAAARTALQEAVESWIPPSGAASAWAEVLARLGAHARAIDDHLAEASLDELSAERSRPLRLAIVGEFNAGKSTFINALLGAEVAPVGVLPTTSTLHHFRWAGLDVVDTPGFNALDPRHGEEARSGFEDADIALWLLDATQAMKESERAAFEKAQRQGIPFLVVANKSDRLSAEDLRTVLRALNEALTQAHLVSWAAPIGVSAKRALAGKLSDPAALEASGWHVAERLIDRAIVARSDELKERALRRRARALTLRLASEWTARAAFEQEQARQAAVSRRALARAAAHIEAEEDALAARIAESLAPVEAGLERDMGLVLAGRDAESAARDPALARYRSNRAVAEITPALLAELGRRVPEVPSDIDASLRALVRGACSCLEPASGIPLVGLARAALATCVERLLSLASAPPPAENAAGVVRELDALAAALAVELPPTAV
jgi:small GTP-binding protein